MISIEPDEMPAAMASENVEVRMSGVREMTVSRISLKAGTDLSPALVGLPGDLCPCPHWGVHAQGSGLDEDRRG
jgi:hypothetical protein